MSQVKLNLQPPPNVDFVTGYPGIPPGSDRPQAAVRGAIEVRIHPQGIKAKWVRIELRKVETLPGGGAANTFYDFVGPSPVNLWNSPEEYSLLRSQDFPFSIRIPESIPPTVALDNLDNGAAIGYELVASICTKGKKGFLRKAKSVVVSTISPITIDKHELHSTWPVYCQPETRYIAQDGVNLSVQRNNTCYGPGDPISVTVVVKSDSLHTIILRTLELSLRETTVFRAGILGPGKKIPPQEKQVNIAESKQAVNVTLYGGSSHSAELSCMLSPDHTTPTLVAARHIDVTYTLCIKALLGTAGPIVMELPVIISNWQRNVSHQAINRIGPAPSLSLFPAGQGHSAAAAAAISTRVDPTRAGPADAVAATLPVNRGNFSNPSAKAYATLPTFGGRGLSSNGLADEFGSTRQPPTAAVANPVIATPIPTTAPIALTAASTHSTSARPSTAGGGNRLTVINAQPQEIPSAPPQRSGSATGSGLTGNQRSWPSAEDEKMRLYEKARLQVEKVHGPAATPPPAAHRVSPPPQAIAASPPRVPTATTASPTKSTWMTAEDEKLRLFQQAQAAVQKTQGLPYTAPPMHTRTDSDQFNRGQPSSGGSGTKPPSAAAALYAQAIHAQNRPAPGPGPSTGNPITPSRIKPQTPNYPTADQEKMALKRYEEAKRAVDRTQSSPYEEPSSGHSPSSAPIAYESLYPNAASTSRPDEPPPFDSSAIPQSHLSEKERLKRAYEASDAATLARQNDINGSPPPPPVSPPTHSQYTNALEEKEALRRKFEARDNAQAKASPTQPPARVPGVEAGIVNANSSLNEATASPGRSPSAGAFRPTPLPPTAGASRVLTAAEEKALMRAKFEARDASRNRKPAAMTNGNKSSSPPAPSTPPPLMPRPPVEYIKETQEEDARLSRLNGEVPVFDISPGVSQRGSPKLNGTSRSGSASASVAALDSTGGKAGAPLDIKPFSPFRNAFEGSVGPLPLPTRLPGE